MKHLKISLVLLMFSTFLILNINRVEAFNQTYTEYNDEYDLLDAMKDQATYNSTVDTETMDKASTLTNRLFGTLTSCIVYAIFALSAFTTACDLLYIAVPPIRTFMYNPSGGQQQTVKPYTQMYGDQSSIQQNTNQQNSNGIFERIRNGEAALISNELKQLLNTPTSMTNSYMNRRPVMRMNYGRRGYGHSGYGRNGYANYGYGMNDFGQQNQMQVPELKIVILEYFKNRVIALVLMAVVMVLLLSSSVFTDCGLNIGEAIMRWLGF